MSPDKYYALTKNNPDDDDKIIIEEKSLISKDERIYEYSSQPNIVNLKAIEDVNSWRNVSAHPQNFKTRFSPDRRFVSRILEPMKKNVSSSSNVSTLKKKLSNYKYLLEFQKVSQIGASPKNTISK